MFCPYCSSNNLNNLSDKYLSCTNCGCDFPLFSPVSGVVTNQYPDPPSKATSLLSLDKIRVSNLKGSRSRQIIDIGCGNGEFLFSAINSGIANQYSYGIEIDQESVKAAEKDGLLILKKLKEINDGALITFWHSIEHMKVEKLKEILEDISQKCIGKKVDIIISTPNAGAGLWEKHSFNYCYFDPQNHMLQYSWSAIEGLVNSYRFYIVKKMFMPTYSIFGIIQTLMNINLKERNILYENLKRSKSNKKLIILFKSIFSFLSSLKHLPNAITYELKKNKASVITFHCKNY